MPTIVIMPLDRTAHDRAAFSCGNASLDRYLREQAAQDMKKRVAAVFVAVASGARSIRGYYTLAQASVPLDALPVSTRRRLPRYPDVPVTLLGRLAIHADHQRTGLGMRLMGDAFRRALNASADIASSGIIVDPIDDRAVAFYSNFGFASLGGAPPDRMFLPMETILTALATIASTS